MDLPPPLLRDFTSITLTGQIKGNPPGVSQGFPKSLCSIVKLLGVANLQRSSHPTLIPLMLFSGLSLAAKGTTVPELHG